MNHIGNDILSIEDPTNLRSFSNSRFLSKVLTRTERAANLSRKGPLFAYILWTCKESAYKIQVKNGLRSAFAPIRFTVELADLDPGQGIDRGTATFGDKRMSTLTYINSRFVHTIAMEGYSALDLIVEGVRNTGALYGAPQSDLTHDHFLGSLVSDLGLSKSAVTFSQDPDTRIPLVQIRGADRRVDLSLSHDGGFISFAYVLS